jgi:hypothetical protein
MIIKLGFDIPIFSILRENDSNQQPTSKIFFQQAFNLILKFYQTRKAADQQTG